MGCTISTYNYVIKDATGIKPYGGYTGGNPVEQKEKSTDGKPVEQDIGHTSGNPVEQKGKPTERKPVEPNVRSTNGKSVEQDGGSTDGNPFEQNGGSTGDTHFELIRGSTCGSPVEQDKEDIGGKRVEQDGGSICGKPVKKDVGYTDDKPVKQDAGSSGGKPVEQDVGYTDDKPVKQDAGSSGGKPVEQDGVSTGENPIKENGGSTVGNRVEQDRGSTGGYLVEKNVGSTGGNSVEEHDGGSIGNGSVEQNGVDTDCKPVEHNGYTSSNPVEQDGESTGGRHVKNAEESTGNNHVEQDGGSTGDNHMTNDVESTGDNAIEQRRGYFDGKHVEHERESTGGKAVEQMVKSTGDNFVEKDGSTGGKPVEQDVEYTGDNPVKHERGSNDKSVEQDVKYTVEQDVESTVDFPVEQDGVSSGGKREEQDGVSTSGNPYLQVDNHARQAPNSVKGSIADLVNYLSTPSKQPKMLVRAIFVWMSENIKYDADGYFGRAERLPGDALSVIKYGKSVCEGYANVTQELCRQAKINVKKISGYAKGVGHSDDHVITTNEDPNHAWNAVELDGKWWLIDGTWGAGHMNDQNQFEKCFEEFYFLADPKKMINSHFPYMDGNMESSMKWQLLKCPVSLDEFNRAVRRWPESYKLGVQPVSHEHGYVEVNGRFEMTFKISGKLDVIFSNTLMSCKGNSIQEIRNTTFGQRDGSMYKIQICPQTVVKYDLTLFGKKAGDEGKLSQLFKYLFKCKKQAETEFRFPETYSQAQTDRCILHEPLKNNLPPNSRVKVSLSSPFLLRVMINQEFLEKDGNKFEGMVKTGSSGKRMFVYGSRKEEGRLLQGLYVFDIK